MVANVYLLKDAHTLRLDLQKVIQPALKCFSAEQAQSSIDLIKQVASIDAGPSAIKSKLVNDIVTLFRPALQAERSWG